MMLKFPLLAVQFNSEGRRQHMDMKIAVFCDVAPCNYHPDGGGSKLL
jgi:hypothetical protein